MSTAVMASVWGQGLAAMRLSAQALQTGMREGDEECHICRADIPATVAFVPCRHKVCFGCMENLRAKNILKVRAVRGGGRAGGRAGALAGQPACWRAVWCGVAAPTIACLQPLSVWQRTPATYVCVCGCACAG
jgi:hypothetical protein